RLEVHSSQLLAGFDAQAIGADARERAGPLPRPADGRDQAAAWKLQIVVGPSVTSVGRLARNRRRRECLGKARPHGDGVWSKAVGSHRIAEDAVKHVLEAICSRHLEVETEQILTNPRIDGCDVFEVNGPFD